MKSDIKEELSVPEKVEVKVDGVVFMKGPKGEVSQNLNNPRITITFNDGKIMLESVKATKREKKILYTFATHIKNMFKGVTEGHFYELKICAAHFPMNVSVSGKDLVIKNFLGENAPRTLPIPDGVTIKVNGDIVRVESSNKELAGMIASKIELLTRVRHRDRRIFQDGIFIINKCGRAIQ
jgi:large subunit ribosomal protein L6